MEKSGSHKCPVWTPEDLARFEIELTEVYQEGKFQDTVTISRRRYGNLVINFDPYGQIATIYHKGEKLY